MGAADSKHTSPSEAPTRLPSYFPRAPKACEKPSLAFLTCFSAASVKTSPDDTTCGFIGLEKCVNELHAYEQCMEKIASKEKRYRVQEEYRVLPKAKQ